MRIWFHLVTMRSKWTWIVSFPLLLLLAAAQDVNWGVKVKCYMVDGMVICPGCNSRGGLICPRVLPDENKCDPELSPTKSPIEETSPMETTIDALPEKIETTEPNVIIDTKPTRTIFDVPQITVQPDNIKTKAVTNDGVEESTEHTLDPIDMKIFLYQILQASNNDRKNRYKDRGRYKRQTAIVEGETCRWNGDCPCPLICCGNGEGRPNQCKKGIRLPPPWG